MRETKRKQPRHGLVFLLLILLYLLCYTFTRFFYRSQTTKLDGPRKYVLNKFTNEKN